MQGSKDVVADFLAAARATPERPAIVDNGRELSYGSVLQRARELALQLGDGCGVVGVMASRSANTIIALLAVLLAGGAYCPIDPAFPDERQKALVRRSGCTTVIATVSQSVAFPGLRVLGMRDLHGHPAPARTDEPYASAPVTLDTPAYVLFTSGSTGEPKGVVTPRGAIGASVDSLRALFEIQPSDRVLQFASLNWDTCFEEIFPALTSGAALVIDRDAHSGSLPRLLRLIRRERVSVLDLPTAVWHELVYYLAEGHAALPECLRLVVIGGEAARAPRLADWCALDTARVRLVNTYGCTETTLITHAIDLHGPRADSSGTRWAEANEVPIGRAMPHVVERLGDAGELLVGGPALAIGYLGNEQATEQRFRKLDFGAGPARYFLTGDRVVRSATGELLHRGRLDGQIKVRGILVNPGEVEAEIARYAGVAAVAVVGVTVADHTTMIAYVVARPGTDAAALSTNIAADLKARVPAHLVPSQLTVVPELVHTPSGKVDRAASHRHHLSRKSGKEMNQ
ncbi:AMP-binding protein [Pendulispora rubella]|uniref:AMP-binding protein n=1 Tax=Pendulispora rubella TaxID=2741070 RepID=A0ABZ2LL33_9BACT